MQKEPKTKKEISLRLSISLQILYKDLLLLMIKEITRNMIKFNHITNHYIKKFKRQIRINSIAIDFVTTNLILYHHQQILKRLLVRDKNKLYKT